MGRKRTNHTVNWNKEYQLNTSAFIDKEQADAYKAFAIDAHERGYCGGDLGRRLRALREGLSPIRIKDVTWIWIMVQVQNAERKDSAVWPHYLLHLVEHDLYHNEYADVLKARFDEFKRVFFTGAATPSMKEKAAQITPYSIISRESFTSKHEAITRVVAIPNADKDFFELINKYLDYIAASYGGTYIGSYVFTMLKVVFSDYDGHLNSALCYDDATFLKHYDTVLHYQPQYAKYDRRVRAGVLGQLIGFYLFLQTEMTEEERAIRFKIYDSNVLKYQRFQYCMENGYSVTRYNIYATPPAADKLLLNPHEMAVRGAGVVDRPVMADFSAIENDTLRKWVKECYWYDHSHVLGTRGKVYSPLIEFLCIVSKRLGTSTEVHFALDDVLTYKRTLIASDLRDANTSRKLSIVRYFFKYIEGQKYTAIDALLYRMLIHNDDPDNEHKEAYTKQEIRDLTAAYRKYADEHNNTHFGILYELYYYIFLILSVSDIRLTNLLETRVDSLTPILTRKGSTEYTLVIKAKNSGDEETVYNITRYVKELIVEVTALSEDVRNEALGPERDYIFSYKRKSHNSVALILPGAFADYHKKMCELSGVRKLSVGAIRNMYEQAAGNRLAKNGYDPSVTKAITGHDIGTQFKYYDKPNMIEFCQRFYQVEIGSIHIAGRVEQSSTADNSQTVMNGCGHCDLDHCMLHGNLECLMCGHFVATLENIPYFEQMIKDLDVAISAQELLHEREFLHNKKRLCVAYLKELYELKGEAHAGNE